MSETVLVTGASGGLGAHLVRALSGRGFRVRALAHRRHVPDADEQVAGSVLDPRTLAAAVEGCDGIVHLAGVTHSRRLSEYERVNVGGTRNLVGAVPCASSVRFVLVSSRAASPQGGAYARSKLEAEDIVRASGLVWTIVRLPEVYGAGVHEGVDRIIEQARTGGLILVPGRGHAEVCPLHLDDAVAACVGALVSPRAPCRTYTLAGDCVTLDEFAQMCLRFSGRRGRVRHVPDMLVRVACELSRVVPMPVYPDQLDRLVVEKPPASQEASCELGFKPRSLESGVASILAS